MKYSNTFNFNFICKRRTAQYNEDKEEKGEEEKSNASRSIYDR